VLKATTTAPTGNATAMAFGGFPGLLYPGTDGQIYDNFGVQGGYYLLGPPTQPITSYHVYNASSAANDWEARLDGLTIYTSRNNQAGFSGGTSIGPGFNGDIAEIIVYDRVLSPQEREMVGFYLNSKYAFTSPARFDFYRDGNYDGLPDGLDRQVGLDPTSMDVDGDGDTNLQDILAGLDPLDPLSVPPLPLPPIPGNPPPTITLTEPANAVPLP